jgi:hypothetical protein
VRIRHRSDPSPRRSRLPVPRLVVGSQHPSSGIESCIHPRRLR